MVARKVTLRTMIKDDSRQDDDGQYICINGDGYLHGATGSQSYSKHYDNSGHLVGKGQSDKGRHGDGGLQDERGMRMTVGA